MKKLIDKILKLRTKIMFNGNKIYKIDENGKKKRVFKIRGLKVVFKGKNSEVIVHEPHSKFRYSKIYCGDNCKVEIKSPIRVRYLKIYALTENTECKIGCNFSTNGKTEILLQEPNRKVIIGNDCMFATNIIIRVSDVHTIVDKDSREILNYGADINIGNHCWIASNSAVLKGVNIADNSIIGYGSVVTKNCETPNSIYAGVPARLIKTNTDWMREAPHLIVE